jgi:hypothetical protein
MPCGILAKDDNFMNSQCGLAFENFPDEISSE